MKSNELGGFTSTVNFDILFDEYTSFCIAHPCNSFSSWTTNIFTYKYCCCLLLCMNKNSNNVQNLNLLLNLVYVQLNFLLKL